MCDSLLGGDATSRELEPAVAESWRLLGPSNFQVKLRSGLRFSDGSKVTAQDALASLQRVIDPDVVSPQKELLSHVFGYKDVQDDKIDAQSIKGLSASSADTLQLQLDRDDSQFIYALTLPMAIPVPRALARKPGFSTHPVCVGPYKMVGSYTGVERTITLERNVSYAGLRPSLSRAGKGWADRIVFRVYSSRAAAFAGLRKGEVDAAQLANDELPLATKSGVPVASVTTGRLEYVGLPDKPPFNDPAVAHALSKALNRDAINAGAFHGGRTPALNLIPPTLPESVLPRRDVRDCQMTTQGSLKDARRVLAAYHVTPAMLGRTPLSFYFNDEYDNAALVSAVRQTWSQLGVTATAQPETFDKLLARGSSPGGFDGLFRMTATAEWADQGAFVLPLVAVDALGKTNFTGFNGTLLERLAQRKLMKAVPAGDQKTQSLALAAATCTVPVIPIAWYRQHLALSSSVVTAANKGVDASAGMPELRELAVG
jgi:ABC-type transport system substrate-binding protein